MANDWGALGLGGMGRVDIRGATPPIGGTGPGGVEGAGLLALLRRLSMGLDDQGPNPLSPDPAAQNSMQNLGQADQPDQPDQMMDLGRMMMGLDQPQPAAPMMNTPPDPAMLTGMGPGMGRGMPTSMANMDDAALWEQLRRMGVPY